MKKYTIYIKRDKDFHITNFGSDDLNQTIATAKLIERTGKFSVKILDLEGKVVYNQDKYYYSIIKRRKP